jgi:cytochrome o ubiquinol oxidase operon protein cyoD
MNEEIQNQKQLFEKSLATYVAGFILSITLTLVAYYMVVDRVWSLAPWTIAILIAVLALVQFFVQLFFFMHLRVRTKPRWRFVVFLFMIMVVLILVGGSIWIMASLNSRMAMTPDQVNQYMNDQVGL